MAYTVINFKTKKLLKEAVQIYHAATDNNQRKKFEIKCFQPGIV